MVFSHCDRKKKVVGEQKPYEYIMRASILWGFYNCYIVVIWLLYSFYIIVIYLSFNCQAMGI